MSDLLEEQENEINDCLKSHLTQIMNNIEIGKLIDWKKIFAYLVLLMDYECFVSMIKKDIFDYLSLTFDRIAKLINDTRESINDAFKISCDTEFKKLQKIFGCNIFVYPTNEIKKMHIVDEEDGEIAFKPIPISKATLKNYSVISKIGKNIEQRNMF